MVFNKACEPGREEKNLCPGGNEFIMAPEDLLEKANSGDSQAQYELGWMFSNTALGREGKAGTAEESHSRPQHRLECGFLDGGEENGKEAVKWFRKAAEKEYEPAELCLGDCYFWGNGVQRDSGEAFRWYRKAARHGNVRSQFMVGICFQKGFGVKADELEAVKWFLLAAGRDCPEATYALAQCYREGTGVIQDGEEALGWLRKAADLGHEEAKRQLHRQ